MCSFVSHTKIVISLLSMSEFLRQRHPSSGSEEPLPTFPFMKIDAYVIYSPIKPPMKMLLWNTQTLEHLKRELNRWLDGEIVDGEKIVKIERKVMVVGPNGETPSLRLVHNDACVLMMMLTSEDLIMLMVIIA